MGNTSQALNQDSVEGRFCYANFETKLRCTVRHNFAPGETWWADYACYIKNPIFVRHKEEICNHILFNFFK